MKVLKFGGTSVADAPAIEKVIEIIQSDLPAISAVIVSACGGITDKLVRACDLAAEGDATYKEIISAISKHHLTVAESLIHSET